MSTIAVTGASGFIGGALVPALAARGHSLVLLDNHSGPLTVEHPDWPVEALDFSTEAGLGRIERSELVLHLGAVSGVVKCAQDPHGSAATNVEGTRRLVERCRSRGIPLAFASSFAVVGRPERLPVSEATPARPTHEYARQKAAGEELTRGLANAGGPASAVLRMSNVYGSYSAESRTVSKGNVITLFLEQARAGRLSVNAPGTQRRDFVHVDDVVRHWVAVGERLLRRPTGSSETLCVASGESRSVAEVAGLVAAAWQHAHPGIPPLVVETVPNPRAGIELVDPEFQIDRRGTDRALGIACRHRVEDAIRHLVEAGPTGAG